MGLTGKFAGVTFNGVQIYKGGTIKLKQEVR
jgi:hypothetical protein